MTAREHVQTIRLEAKSHIYQDYATDLVAWRFVMEHAETLDAALREAATHAEAIRDRHNVGVTYDAEIDDHVEVCTYCVGEGPCPDHLDASAILALLGATSNGDDA